MMADHNRIMADHKLVLKFWSKVKSDLPGHGGKVLTGLFKEHPDTKKLFPDIPKSDSDLPGNAVVGSHGAKVLTNLGKLLKAEGAHAAIIKKLATSHVNTDKIVLNHFRLITELLMKVMEEKAGLDADEKGALKRVMDRVIDG